MGIHLPFWRRGKGLESMLVETLPSSRTPQMPTGWQSMLPWATCLSTAEEASLDTRDRLSWTISFRTPFRQKGLGDTTPIPMRWWTSIWNTEALHSCPYRAQSTRTGWWTRSRRCRYRQTTSFGKAISAQCSTRKVQIPRRIPTSQVERQYLSPNQFKVGIITTAVPSWIPMRTRRVPWAVTKDKKVWIQGSSICLNWAEKDRPKSWSLKSRRQTAKRIWIIMGRCWPLKAPIGKNLLLLKLSWPTPMFRWNRRGTTPPTIPITSIITKNPIWIQSNLRATQAPSTMTYRTTFLRASTTTITRTKNSFTSRIRICLRNSDIITN